MSTTMKDLFFKGLSAAEYRQTDHWREEEHSREATYTHRVAEEVNNISQVQLKLTVQLESRMREMEAATLCNFVPTKKERNRDRHAKHRQSLPRACNKTSKRLTSKRTSGSSFTAILRRTLKTSSPQKDPCPKHGSRGAGPIHAVRGGTGHTWRRTSHTEGMHTQEPINRARPCALCGTRASGQGTTWKHDETAERC